jgi:hypothetical protein
VVGERVVAGGSVVEVVGGSVVVGTAVVGGAVVEGATVGGGTTPVVGDDVVDADKGTEASNSIGRTGSSGERSNAKTTP